MLKARTALSALWILGTLCVGNPSSQAQMYSQMVVFGDSLSDTGNLFAVTGGLFPPPSQYYQGRYSNGLLWVENLALQLGLPYNQATNFALAGAGSGTNHVSPFLPGMQQQIQWFADENPVADPNALYIVWAGANDYLAIGSTDPVQPSENIGTAITKLAALGARNFLIPNLPDLGQLPGTRNTAEGIAASALSHQHNLHLAAKLDALRGQVPQTEIDLFDTATLFNSAIANPALYGFTNVTDSALFTGTADPGTYLFWDDVHPSAQGHQLIAQFAFAALNTVPEPGLSALIVGLSAFGGIALRRKKIR